MKTNFGKKLLLVLITFISMLTVYNNPSNANSNVLLNSPKSRVKYSASKKSQLPNSLTGVYAESLSHCKAGSYSWEISSEIMEEGSGTYSNYAHVNKITLQDGGYNISADSFSIEFTLKEGFKPKLLKQDRRYRIVPDQKDNKIELSVEDLTSDGSMERNLVRCKQTIGIM